MSPKRLAICAFVTIPVFTGLGFFRGCSKANDPDFLKAAIRELSTATMASNGITIDLWHLKSPLKTWAFEYKSGAVPTTAVAYHLKEPLTTRIGVDSPEVIFTAAYGQIIEDPTTHKRRAIYQPSPAFLFTISGYTVGYFCGASAGLGEDTSQMIELAKDPAFRQEVLDGFYSNIAAHIVSFIALRPTLPGAQNDRFICESFERREHNSDTQRAELHSIVIRHLNSNEFRQYLTYEPWATPLGLIKLAAALSGLIWFASAVYLFRTRRHKSSP